MAAAGKDHLKDHLDDAKQNAGDAARRVEQGADEAQAAGQRAIANPIAVTFARLGFAIKGVLYITIGLVAAGIAFGRGGGSPDQRTALLALHSIPFGRLLLPFVTLGLFAYALWNFADALLDADHEGHGVKALLERIGCVAIGVSYMGIALSALQLSLGTGNGGSSSDAKTQDWTARLLAFPFGVPLIMLAGLVCFGLAVYQFYRANSEHFDHQLALGTLRPGMRHLVALTGKLGYCALGVVLSLVGLFLVLAALHHNPGEAKGLGGALQVVASQAYGSVLLGVVAVGLIGFGVFALVEARYRRIQPH